MKIQQLTDKTYLGHGVLDNLLVLHIALVADEQLVHALRGITVDLLQPLLDVVEGVHVGHIVHHADTMRTTVIGRRDGSESFLTSGVPLSLLLVTSGRMEYWSIRTYDLQFHGLTIQFNGSDFLEHNIVSRINLSLS